MEALQVALGDTEAAEGRAAALGKVRLALGREWGGTGWRGGGVQPGVRGRGCCDK